MFLSYKKALSILFFLFSPCLALAQYPKAMDFSKLYQGKIDSVAVIHPLTKFRKRKDNN